MYDKRSGQIWFGTDNNGRDTYARIVTGARRSLFADPALYGGVRPFGTALLVGGVDDAGTHLYETDPSGALVSYKAGSIGAGRNTVMELFEEKFKDGMAQDDAVLLGLEALQKASEEKLDAKAIEVGLVAEGQKFRRLPEDEITGYMRRLPGAS